MGGLRQDLLNCWRMMRKSPAFTAVAIVTLALTIGANTAIISLADALFRRTIPGANTERVVGIYGSFGGRVHGAPGFSHEEYLMLRERSRTLTQISAHYSTSPLTLTLESDSRIVNGSVASAELFRLFHVRPILGRFFDDVEDHARLPVAVLAFNAWQEWFAGDPAVLGRTVTLNGIAFTVIGVAPSSFRGVLIAEPNDVWIPMSMLDIGYRQCFAFARGSFSNNCRILALFGRLAPRRALNQAQAELGLLGQRIWSARDTTVTFTLFGGAFRLVARPLRGVGEGEQRDDHRTVVVLLLSAATLLLVVACANLAGTLLVRGIARRREIAIRRAIGASAARIVRQLAVEGVVLSLIGAAVGLLVATWIEPLLQAVYLGTQFQHDLRLSPMVMACAVLLSVIAGLAFGVGPAVQIARVDLTTALKGETAGGRSRARARDVLLALQVGLACLGLVSAGSLVQSMRNVLRDTTPDASHLVVTRVRPRLVGYDSTRARAVLREIVTRLEAVPGVHSVSLGGTGPVWSYAASRNVWRPGQEPPAGAPKPEVIWKQVGPRFFPTMGIQLIAGREIDAHDVVGSPTVVVVNESLARALWPNGSAIGTQLVVDGVEATVVGIARDRRVRKAAEWNAPVVYTAFWQDPTAVEANFAVRVTGDADAAIALLQRTARAVDRAVPVMDFVPVERQLADRYKSVRLAGSAVSYAGILAMVLSALGVYGVLAFTVTTRTREIAVRVALGARHRDVAHAVYMHAMRVVAVGVARGLAASWASMRLMSAFIYGTDTSSPWFAIRAVALLAAVSLAAATVPLRRALRIHPREALQA